MTDKNSKAADAAIKPQGFAHGVAPGVKWAVIIMGIMLIVGMIVVFSTIIYRTVKLSEGKTISKVTKIAPYPPLDLPVSDQAKISSVALDGNRLALHVIENGKTSIIIVDIKRGQVISRVTLKPQN